jgi:cytoplasmic iron level regulating protein YaaA (DUF328/UPF0246 family)
MLSGLYGVLRPLDPIVWRWGFAWKMRRQRSVPVLGRSLPIS